MTGRSLPNQISDLSLGFLEANLETRIQAQLAYWGGDPGKSGRGKGSETEGKEASAECDVNKLPLWTTGV